MFVKLYERFKNKANNLKITLLGGNYNNLQNFDLGYISSYLLLFNTLIYMLYNTFRKNTTYNESIYFCLSLTLSILYLHLDNNNYLKKNKDLILIIGIINILLIMMPYFVNLIYIISRIESRDKIFDGFINSLFNYLKSL